MIEVIVSLVIVGIFSFYYIFDGDLSKIPFLNKSNISKTSIGKPLKKRNSKYKVADFKKHKKTQDYLGFKTIKSTGKKALIERVGNKYVGGIEIYGNNYNLLSTDEKLLLEEIYQSVNNGLNYPVQLLIQSRKMDIDNYNHIYKIRIDELKEMLKREENKISFLANQIGKEEEIESVRNNIIRLTRQINYGIKLIEFTNKVSYNSDILDKKYFILTSYTYDSTQFNETQTEEEKFVTAFNTINNRLTSILSGFKGVQGGRFLSGIEAATLLYMSYNKNDSSNYKINKAIESGFSHFITTAKPIEHKIYENEEKKLEDIIESNVV